MSKISQCHTINTIRMGIITTGSVIQVHELADQTTPQVNYKYKNYLHFMPASFLRNANLQQCPQLRYAISLRLMTKNCNHL